MPVKVWGWAEPGESVAVSINGKSATAVADDQGRWDVKLDSMPAGGPHELSIKGKNQITLKDVLVGEVWVCSGQSNMAWSVRQAKDADLEIAAASFPEIRLISVPQVGTQEPQYDFAGKWDVCSPQTVGDFSAVGYFFGRQIHQTLGVPVGLIDNAWGGSAAEAWVRRDLFEAEDRYQPLLARWEQIVANVDKQAANYEAQLEKWQAAVRAAGAEGKPLPRRPADPRAQLTGQHRPANLYNGVLRPIIGYTIRGVIWYQGESNASRAYQYRHLFPMMIQNWRDDWGQGDFSFYWVQLADFKAERSEPGESDWAELREAQTQTMDKLPNTGEAVIIDIGEADDIHPKNKQDVGKRLARWALSRDYGMELPHRSPSFKSMEKQGNKLILTFDHVGGGLDPLDVAEIRGFTIAGEDRKFHPAQAKLIAPNQVEVSSERVSDPVAARYGWADNPVVNLYSREGLPVTPFRTDDWPGVTAEAN
jgi:sialate O-acetylesterase